MKRVAAIVGALLVAVALAASGRPSGDTGTPSGGYRVTAIFDNAGAAYRGEDVKAAGARIGSIEALDLTKDRRRAAITMSISDPRFVPFHANAHCALRPEGLLAVKFIDCDPGTGAGPELGRIGSGVGEGTHLLPVQRTSSPVDLDLLNNMMRRPTGERLAILLSELGTGLAGRGRALNAVIHRANPALGQTDRMLGILARQSRALAQFSRDADRVLGPLATRRSAIAGFIRTARRSAEASASRAPDIERSLRRLPRFLTGLRRQMAEVDALTNQGVPVLRSLSPAAPAVSRATAALAPFARAATPAVRALAAASDRLDPQIARLRPLIASLARVGRRARPVAAQLDALTASFAKELGLRHIAELLYGATNAVNAFDSVGHYARGEALSGACSEYTPKGFFGCDAQWGPSARSAKPIGPVPDTGAATVVTPVPPPYPATAARSQAAGSHADPTPVLDYLLGR